MTYATDPTKEFIASFTMPLSGKAATYLAAFAIQHPEHAFKIINDQLEMWPGGTCLSCKRVPATHRFSVLGGPDGWLCEVHKDEPVLIDGTLYGDNHRRSHHAE